MQHPVEPKPKRRWIPVTILAVIIALIAIGTGVYLGLRGADDTPGDVPARAEEVAAQYVKGTASFSADDYRAYLDAVQWHTTEEFGERNRNAAVDTKSLIVDGGMAFSATITSTTLVTASPISAVQVAVDLTASQYRKGQLIGDAMHVRRTITMDCTRDCLVFDDKTTDLDDAK